MPQFDPGRNFIVPVDHNSTQMRLRADPGVIENDRIFYVGTGFDPHMATDDLATNVRFDQTAPSPTTALSIQIAVHYTGGRAE